MKKSITKLLSALLACTTAAAITSCSAGATTPDVCPYPTFTQATAESLLTAWGQGLQHYQTYPKTDVYVNAGYFTMSFYTPDATLQPTLSRFQRFGTQNIYNYFTSFLAKKPLMSFTPESTSAVALGCGYGGYSGDYNFVTESGTPSQATTQARFSFIYEYMPINYSEKFTVESGSESGVVKTQQNTPGWYIFAQQSSMLPPSESSAESPISVP